MIGNDIVDLAFVEPPAYRHVALLRRVCGNHEMNFVRTGKDPAANLAMVWASKEAAFKLFLKKDPSVHFIPKDFVVEFQEPGSSDFPGRGHVEHGGKKASLSLFITERWVHAIARDSLWTETRWCVGTLAGGGRNASARAESKLARALGSKLLCEFGPPDARLEFAGRIPVVKSAYASDLRVDVSLSHHGSFAAAAIIWPREASLLEATKQDDLQISAREDACSTYIA